MDRLIADWEYVIAVDPSGYPLRILKSNIDDAMPELENWYCGRSKQFVTIVQKQGTTVAETRELVRRTRGDVVRLEVDRPAAAVWKPPLNIELPDQLRTVRGVDDPEEEAEYDSLITKV